MVDSMWFLYPGRGYNELTVACQEVLCKAVSTNFVDSWTNGLSADIPTFLAQFSPQIEWYDHAFFARRRGHSSLARFRTRWLTAIENFGTDIKATDILEDGTAVIRCVYHGTMVGPLPGRAASGKTFRANVLILLKINEEGKIQRVDEYYTATLDEGVDVEDYKLLDGEKHGSRKI